jgi:hypothetical protein
LAGFGQVARGGGIGECGDGFGGDIDNYWPCVGPRMALKCRIRGMRLGLMRVSAIAATLEVILTLEEIMVEDKSVLMILFKCK